METGDNVERKNLDESVQVGHNTAIKPPQMNAREVSMFLLRKERGARKEGRETNKEETKK